MAEINTTIGDRISLFMMEEKMTAMKFAEIMEIRPSNVSHFISGRNNPNFDFISKFFQRFPNVNPDWFINGSGTMYRNNEISNSSNHQPLEFVEKDLFNFEDEIIDEPESDQNNNEDLNSNIEIDLTTATHDDVLNISVQPETSPVELSSIEIKEDSVFDINNKNKNISGDFLDEESTSKENVSSDHNEKLKDETFEDKKIIHQESVINTETKSTKTLEVKQDKFQNINKIILIFDDNTFSVLNQR